MVIFATRGTRNCVQTHTRTRSNPSPATWSICGHSLELGTVDGCACPYLARRRLACEHARDTPSPPPRAGVLAHHPDAKMTRQTPPQSPTHAARCHPQSAATRSVARVRGCDHSTASEGLRAEEERCAPCVKRGHSRRGEWHNVINTICGHVLRTEEVVDLHHRWPEWTGEHPTTALPANRHSLSLFSV
jgi:hypothetical protein